MILLTVGCAPQDPKAKLRDSTKRYNEAADLLGTVKDANSLEAAKPKLKNFFAWAREQENNAQHQAKGNRAPTGEEMKAAWKEAAKVMDSPEFKEMMNASSRYMSEAMRCQLQAPGFREFYQEEMGQGRK